MTISKPVLATTSATVTVATMNTITLIRSAIRGPLTAADSVLEAELRALPADLPAAVEAAADMADAALYSAKSQGRDRVVVFDPVRNDVDQRRA